MKHPKPAVVFICGMAEGKTLNINALRYSSHSHVTLLVSHPEVTQFSRKITQRNSWGDVPNAHCDLTSSHPYVIHSAVTFDFTTLCFVVICRVLVMLCQAVGLIII